MWRGWRRFWRFRHWFSAGGGLADNVFCTGGWFGAALEDFGFGTSGGFGGGPADRGLAGVEGSEESSRIGILAEVAGCQGKAVKGFFNRAAGPVKVR